MDIWYTKDVDSRVSQMFETLQTRQDDSAKRFVITITREYGCNSYDLAKDIATELNRYQSTKVNWAVYDRLVMEKVANKFEVSLSSISGVSTEHRSHFQEFLESLIFKIPDNDKIYSRVVHLLRQLAKNGNAIIIGRGGAFLTQDHVKAVHINLVAPFAWRLQRVVALASDNNPDSAAATLQKYDRERERFYTRYFDVDISSWRGFDLSFNNSRLSNEEMVQSVVSLMEKRDSSLHYAS